MNIYVGNLPRTATEETLRMIFENHGSVDSIRIMLDKFTNEPRGFAFVTMENDDEATKAIEALNDYVLEGRNLKVSEARPPENRNRAPRSGGFNRGPRLEGGFGGSRGGSSSRGGFGGKDRY